MYQPTKAPAPILAEVIHLSLQSLKTPNQTNRGCGILPARSNVSVKSRNFMQNPSVLVLDSGIGGLSITQEIRKLCPQLHITYLADLAAFPYGPKSGEQI